MSTILSNHTQSLDIREWKHCIIMYLGSTFKGPYEFSLIFTLQVNQITTDEAQ